MTSPSMADALELQATACGRLGSPFYEALLRDLLADHERGGPVFRLLDGVSDRPVHDATPLRLLGAVHRLVLRGDAPTLAEHYPSAGGDGAPVELATFLDVMTRHDDEIRPALHQQVQTNEVGRAAALVIGFAAVSATWKLPLRVLEVGASAGLNLRFDHFGYDLRATGPGGGRAGDPTSPVVFRDVWTRPVDLRALTNVVERRGCDVAPIDLRDPDARLRLLSFVWPDQTERFARLRAAIEVARRVPATVDQADAGDWLTERLSRPTEGIATVVYHSIVWQYLGSTTRERLKAALHTAGERATTNAPVAWLRLEPAGPHADLRLTTWPGGHEALLATSGYHGADITPIP